MPNLHRAQSSSQWEKISAYGFGVIFVITLLTLAVIFPNPTPFQYTTFRIVLSLACAGIAAVIPGFLSIRTDTMGVAIRAGGAIAVFVMVYLINPAQLVVQQSTAPNSPNIQGVQGAVTIIQKPSSEPPLQNKEP